MILKRGHCNVPSTYHIIALIEAVGYLPTGFLFMKNIS